MDTEITLPASPEDIVFAFLQAMLEKHFPEAELTTFVDTSAPPGYPFVYLDVEASEDLEENFPWEAYESPSWDVSLTVTLYDYTQRIEDDIIKLHRAVKAMQLSAAVFDRGRVVFDRVYTQSYLSSTGVSPLGPTEILCSKTGRYTTRIKGGKYAAGG